MKIEECGWNWKEASRNPKCVRFGNLGAIYEICDVQLKLVVGEYLIMILMVVGTYLMSQLHLLLRKVVGLSFGHSLKAKSQRGKVQGCGASGASRSKSLALCCAGALGTRVAKIHPKQGLGAIDGALSLFLRSCSHYVTLRSLEHQSTKIQSSKGRNSQLGNQGEWINIFYCKLYHCYLYLLIVTWILHHAMNKMLMNCVY